MLTADGGGWIVSPDAARLESVRVSRGNWIIVGVRIRRPSLINERVDGEEQSCSRVVVAPYL